MMKNNSSPRTLKKAITWLAMASMTLVLTPTAVAAKENNKAAATAAKPDGATARAQIDISKIRWPLPPAVPRIQMLSEFFGEKPAAHAQQPEKTKKPSWKERMAGLQTQQHKTTGESERGNQLLKPYGVVADSKGRIYTADAAARSVFIFDQNGNSLFLYQNGGLFRFKNIIGLAIDDSDRLFVTDADLRQVTAINPDGEPEAVFGSQQLARPAGAAVDSKNRLLYVADPDNNRIAVFDADSFIFLRFIGTAPKTKGDHDPGTLSKPTNVAVGTNGKLYVTDTLNSRVQIFDAGGKFIGMFGRLGVGPGTLLRPKGIGIDCDGHIWVADAGQNRVQIFDEDGHLLGYFGQLGNLPGQFLLPAGLFIDKSNRVIISDQWNGRVQIFRYIPESEASAMKAAPGNTTGSEQTVKKTGN
jgi:DNA-binding beta-propeller fold protein YncE